MPTSYMAIKSSYDFVGGYEDDTRAGLLHVANNHISPGKKQWTWGCGEFGLAWDRNLTDEDGPYIELMTGVFTDNQPDFTWLMPGEEKTFVQYFLPYRELGAIKNANKDVLLNLDIEGEKIRLKIFATSHFKNVKVVLNCDRDAIFESVLDLSPETVMDELVDAKATSLQGLSVEIYSQDGTELLSWKPEKDEIKKPAEPAKPALQPNEIQTTEQLYLTGLHLEQYRHATYSPVDYYREALKRDPSDVRNNNAMGLWLLRRGKFAESKPYFCAAIETQLQRNPNPYDGEPLYNQGVALYYQQLFAQAYESFYKATWNAATKSSSFLFLARISAIKGKYERAMQEVNQALAGNAHHHQARHLQTALLRKLGLKEQALGIASNSLEIDGFNVGCLYEKWLLSDNAKDLEQWQHLMRDSNNNYRELALDYASFGSWNEALSVMQTAIDRCSADSMDHYYAGWICGKLGQSAECKKHYKQAGNAAEVQYFPNKIQEIDILADAIAEYPNDGRAA